MLAVLQQEEELSLSLQVQPSFSVLFSFLYKKNFHRLTNQPTVDCMDTNTLYGVAADISDKSIMPSLLFSHWQ